MPSKIGIRLASKTDLYQTNIDTQLSRSTVTALTLKDFVKDGDFGSLLQNTSIPGSKIGSDLAGSSLTDETVTGNVNNTGTSPVKGKIALSTITGANIANNSVTLGKLPTFTGPSVIGRASSTSGDLAAISASADGQVLVRLSDSLTFSTLDASSIGSGSLPVNRGGTGNTTSPTNGQLLIGNSSSGFSLGTLTAGNNITITNNSGSITIAATSSFPVATATTTGSQTLPSGIIIKWGEVILNNFTEGSGLVSIGTDTAGTSFPNACFQVVATLDIGNTASPANANVGVQITQITRTTFSYYLQSYNATTAAAGTTLPRIRWIAIGN